MMNSSHEFIGKMHFIQDASSSGHLHVHGTKYVEVGKCGSANLSKISQICSIQLNISHLTRTKVGNVSSKRPPA